LPPSAPPCPQLEFILERTRRTGSLTNEWCDNLDGSIAGRFVQSDFDRCSTFYTEPYAELADPSPYPFDCSGGCAKCEYRWKDGQFGCRAGEIVYGCPAPPLSPPPASPPTGPPTRLSSPPAPSAQSASSSVSVPPRSSLPSAPPLPPPPSPPLPAAPPSPPGKPTPPLPSTSASPTTSGGFYGGGFQCPLDFLSSAGQGGSALDYEADGDLAIEFALSEAIYLATQELNSHDAYTCLLDPLANADFLATIPFIDVVPSPLLECLDVGSASTMSGFMFAGVDELRTRGINAGTKVDPILFGSVATCNEKPVADGRINAFDLAVLMWASFGKAPYDNVWFDAPTVDGRNLTALRCGNKQTLQEYAVALDDDFCSAGQNVSSPSTDTNPPYRCLETSVEAWSYVTGSGEWTRLRFFNDASVRDEDKLAFALELHLVGVDAAQATIDDEPPPAYGCTGLSCAPTANPRAVSIHLQQRDDLVYGDGYLGTCNQAAAFNSTVHPSGRHALGKHGVLSLMQDQPEVACPFDVFVWVPILLRETLQNDLDQPCGGYVGVQAGSAAMDGMYGAVQCFLVCVGQGQLRDGSEAQGLTQVAVDGGFIIVIIASIIAALVVGGCFVFAALRRYKLVARPSFRKAVPGIASAAAGARAAAYMDPEPSAANVAEVAALEARVS